MLGISKEGVKPHVAWARLDGLHGGLYLLGLSEYHVASSLALYLGVVLDLVKVDCCETLGCLGEAFEPYEGFCLLHILLFF